MVIQKNNPGMNRNTLSSEIEENDFPLSFIDRIFKLCYILGVFVKVKEVKRILRREAERGTNPFFGFFLSSRHKR